LQVPFISKDQKTGKDEIDPQKLPILQKDEKVWDQVPPICLLDCGPHPEMQSLKRASACGTY